jgi:hypothetical protein
MTLLKRLIALIFLERKFAGNLYNAQKVSSASQFPSFQAESHSDAPRILVFTF